MKQVETSRLDPVDSLWARYKTAGQTSWRSPIFKRIETLLRRGGLVALRTKEAMAGSVFFEARHLSFGGVEGKPKGYPLFIVGGGGPLKTNTSKCTLCPLTNRVATFGKVGRVPGNNQN